MICLFLVISTLIAYWQVTKADFVLFDDDEYVTENQHVQKGLDPSEIVWAFTSTHSNNWHPLTFISHMIDVQLFGLKPGMHHLINLLFHIANALLLFIVLRKMTDALWPAAFVAALFALHPLHVESVAWIAERKDVLSTFFFLLTLWTYCYYVKNTNVKRYLLVLMFFILGVMSKPMIITLPFVLLLLDFWPFGRFRETQNKNLIPSEHPPQKLNKRKRKTDIKQKGKQDNVSEPDNIGWGEVKFHWQAIFPLLKEKIPFFVVTLASIVITIYAQKDIIKDVERYPLQTRIANTFVSYISYIEDMFWPDGLAVFYPYGNNLSNGHIVLSIALIIIISAIIIILRRPYLIVGWLWYLGTLIPVIGLVQVGLQAKADRYTYIPLIGIFIIITYGIAELVQRWPKFKIFFASAAGGIILTLIILTHLQVETWQNSSTLYQHAAEVTTNNDWAHLNIGVVMAQRGDKENAIVHFKEAIRIKPYAFRVYNNWALLLSKTGEHKEAISLLEKSLRINDKNFETHYLLGISFANIGEIDKALFHLSEALRLSPQQPIVHNAAGAILLNMGKIDEAIDHFRQALLIAPAYPEARKNIRIALELKKNAAGQENNRLSN